MEDEATIEKVDDKTIRVITPQPDKIELLDIGTLTQERENLTLQMDDLKKRAELEVAERTSRIAEIDALLTQAAKL